jgi:four helix bundle protein
MKEKDKYNLEKRTGLFGRAVIRTLKKMRQDAVNRRLISQCVASSGSIGANYCEANEAESKRDFVHKISICKKEIKETRHWLTLLIEAEPSFKPELEILWQEAQELLLIFSKIIHSCRNNN